MSWEVWMMPSERTFFDKAIFRRAIAHAWWLGAAYAAVLCFLVLSGGRSFGAMDSDNDWFIGFSIMNDMTRWMVVAAAAAAVCMTIAVNGWMFRKSSAAYIAALPVTREALFLSSMTAGLLLLALPCVIMALVSLVLYGGIRSCFPPYLLYSALTVLLMSAAFFGIASFCTAFTGNAAVLPAVYAALLYGFVGLEVVGRYIAEFLLFGVKGSGWVLTFLSPVYYFTGSYVNSIDRALLLAAGYAAAGAIFAGLAVILFHRRKMEAAGEIVAISAMRPIFRWGMAIMSALALALLVLKTVLNSGGYVGVSSGGNPMQVGILLLAMLFGAAVGWFGAEALMRKTTRVFDRHWKGLGILCAVLCVTVIGVDADLFGVERYQPDEEEIGYATVTGWAYYDAVRIVEPENIRALLTLQSDIISHKREYEKTSAGISGQPYIEMRYYDKNGELLSKRVYSFTDMSDAVYVTGGDYTLGTPRSAVVEQDVHSYENLLNSREVTTQRMEYSLDPARGTVIASTVQWYEESWQNARAIQLTADEFWELYNTCILPDLKDGTIGTVRVLPDGEYFESLEPISIDATGIYAEDDGKYYYTYYTARPLASSERTNEWLRAHGVTVQTLAEMYGVS